MGDNGGINGSKDFVGFHSFGEISVGGQSNPSRSITQHSFGTVKNQNGLLRVSPRQAACDFIEIYYFFRSKRSSSMTFTQAATKSFTNFSSESAQA